VTNNFTEVIKEVVLEEYVVKWVPPEFEWEYAKPNITKITESGEVTITMDKPVIVRPDWENEELVPDLFDVRYIKKSNEETELLGFEIRNITKSQIIIKLNFSNPLYVSQGDYSD